MFYLLRSQRLQFDVSSPNGILLFREISKCVAGYGKKFLCRPFLGQCAHLKGPIYKVATKNILRLNYFEVDRNILSRFLLR